MDVLGGDEHILLGGGRAPYDIPSARLDLPDGGILDFDDHCQLHISAISQNIYEVMTPWTILPFLFLIHRQT